MSTERLPTTLIRTALVLLLGVVLLFGLQINLGSASESQPDWLVREAETVDSAPSTVFLPALFRGHPLETLYGTESGPFTAPEGFDLMVSAGISWARRNAVEWSSVEAVEGVYDWSALSGLEAELIHARQRHVEPIVIVRDAPDWAQKYPGYDCGPIRQDKFDEFAAFMTELVNRYSPPPYKVKYWEFWNMPDHPLSSTITEYGCWGEPGDTTYYGGDYYAEMLKVVYPAVKAADPEAQVLHGGLLLDCDPDNPPPVNPTCDIGNFFPGVLANGGGDYFDGVSFHALDYYGDELGVFGNPNWYTAYDTTGTVVEAKVQFVKDTLSTYGVTGKFLMNNRSGLLCYAPWGMTCGETFETTKAYYVAQVYADSSALGLRGNTWEFWWDRNSELYESDLTPLPAYYAYETSRQILGEASYLQDIMGYPGVSGYEFSRANDDLWIVWSLDGANHAITLPGTPVAIYDVDGDPVAITNPLTVGLEPYYILWGP